jgi:uncharacterized protein YdeI (YjbR/CyaY-like superfamily)
MRKDEPLYFETLSAWMKWLAKNHASAEAQWVGFYKRGSGRPSITWPESVDGALCYGWIDGLRQSIDDTRYKIRFTPRKKTSHWSHVNVRRVQELIAQKRMTPAGLAAFEARSAERTGLASHEQKQTPKLPPAAQKQLEANAKAWAYFQSCPPWYQRGATHWVMSAKKEETRSRRLATLIADCEAQRNIKPLTWTEKKPRRS